MLIAFYLKIHAMTKVIAGRTFDIAAAKVAVVALRPIK